MTFDTAIFIVCILVINAFIWEYLSTISITPDLEILEKIGSLIPEQISQLNEDDKLKPLLEWFMEIPLLRNLQL